MRELYRAGRSMKAIGEAFGVSHTAIKRVFIEDKVPVRSGGAYVISPEQEDEIVALHLAGKNMTAIARQLACSTEPVKRVLRETGHRPVPVKGGYGAASQDVRAEIVRLYTSGSSRYAVSRATGVWHYALERVLQEEGIAIRDDRRRQGESSHLFKEGKWVGPDGYVRKWVADDDPMASIRNGRYALEHRLVMSRHLGRPLTRSERVHHKNGVKDDNRIENLELWSHSHPPGQRISDKLPHCPTCTCDA